MSDLQCPATFVVVPPRAALSEVPPEGFAAAYASPARAGELRASLGASTPVAVESGLGTEAPQELATTLEELADLHRGERVALAPDGLPPRCRPGEVTVVRVDADGWAVAPG